MKTENFNEAVNTDEFIDKIKRIRECNDEILERLENISNLWDSGKATDEEIKQEVRKTMQLTKTMMKMI